MARATKKAPPYLKVEWDEADANALKALQRGDADADQQKRALDWILRHAAMIREVTFQPGMPDASAFAEGRRFVGLTIAQLLTVSTRDLRLAEQPN